MYGINTHLKCGIWQPDQTAPLGAVWSGATLFDCMQK